MNHSYQVTTARRTSSRQSPRCSSTTTSTPSESLFAAIRWAGSGRGASGVAAPDVFCGVRVERRIFRHHRNTRAARLLKGLPPYQEAALHYYDAEDYAFNAFNMPIVGYGGEKDAHAGASQDFARRGAGRVPPDAGDTLPLDDDRSARAVSGGPDTGHSWHAGEQGASRKPSSEKPLDETAGKPPNHVRFVTYTTRWNNAHWVTVEGLEETYKRADVDAKRTDDLKQYTVTTKNVSRVRFDVPAASFTIDGQPTQGWRESHVRESNGKWAVATGKPTGLRKIHGLQGPIEDAFRDGFLAVRGTGQPWNDSRAELHHQRFDVFRSEFAKWMRGDIRVKDDTDVSAADIANYNLVLFGDPGSNSVIAEVIGQPADPVDEERDHGGFAEVSCRRSRPRA